MHVVELKYLNHQSPYALMDAKTFINQKQGISIEPEECKVSFDVISLFPSIPIDLAKEVVTWLLMESPIDIPTESIMEMLNHCLNNFGIFDDEYYKQNIGVPMGSPISDFIAEAVMQSTEAKIMAQYRPRSSS